MRRGLGGRLLGGWTAWVHALRAQRRLGGHGYTFAPRHVLSALCTWVAAAKERARLHPNALTVSRRQARRGFEDWAWFYRAMLRERTRKQRWKIARMRKGFVAGEDAWLRSRAAPAGGYAHTVAEVSEIAARSQIDARNLRLQMDRAEDRRRLPYDFDDFDVLNARAKPKLPRPGSGAPSPVRSKLEMDPAEGRRRPPYDVDDLRDVLNARAKTMEPRPGSGAPSPLRPKLVPSQAWG